MPTPEHDQILTTAPEETRTQQQVREALHEEEVFDLEELAENTYAASHKQTMTEQESWNVLQAGLEKHRKAWKQRQMERYEAANRGKL